MHLETRRTLPRDLIEEIYPSYVEAWDHLQPHVAARHVLSFGEFAEEMSDRNIAKVLVLDDDTGSVLAMTTLITDISSVPWANATYYQQHYAEEIRRGAFFYVGYTIVHQPLRGTRAVYLMRQEVDHMVRQADGVIGFDMSHFVLTRGIGRRVERLFPSAHTFTKLDEQTYYVADYRPVATVPEAGAPTPPEFQVVSMGDHPELMDEVVELLSARWPAYMLAGHSGHGVAVQPLLRRLPEYHVALVDELGALRGAGLSMPIQWDQTVGGLPGGWDDAIVRSAELIERGAQPDSAVGLSITVAPELGGRKLGRSLIQGLIDAARRVGAPRLICPVRPTRKALYPMSSFESYVGWKTEDGRVFDPWVRDHLELGGTALEIAPESMRITGTVAEWQGWLGQALPVSGPYAIDGGLAPLYVDHTIDLGIYREPNLWIVHQTG